MVAWFHSRDLHEVPFILVLLIEAAAVVSVVLAPQHWLRAIGVLCAGLVVGGLFRLVLSNEQAGMLRVRRRTFDVTCFWGFAVLAMAFALTLPQH